MSWVERRFRGEKGGAEGTFNVETSLAQTAGEEDAGGGRIALLASSAHTGSPAPEALIGQHLASDHPEHPRLSVQTVCLHSHWPGSTFQTRCKVHVAQRHRAAIGSSAAAGIELPPRLDRTSPLPHCIVGNEIRPGAAPAGSLGPGRGSSERPLRSAAGGPGREGSGEFWSGSRRTRPCSGRRPPPG